MTIQFVIYKDIKYTLQTSGRYYSCDKGRKRNGTRLLHRHIWIDNFGELPEGFVVHHKDGNWENNEVLNLAILPLGLHSKHHWEELKQCKSFMIGARKRMDYAKNFAVEWHSSLEGVEWHRQKAKKQWQNAKTKTKQCQCCGNDYETYMMDSQYCSSACAQKIGFRRYFTDKRSCSFCEKEFMANRHRKTAYCSRICSNRHRFGK